MSLTSLLKDKHSQELRDKLKTEFPSPSFGLKTWIKAPLFANDCRIVGTAFDYLMRFHLQFINPETFIQRENWVADIAFTRLTNYLSGKKGMEIAIGSKKDKIVNANLLKSIIAKQYKEAKKNYLKYIGNGQITDELAKNALFLAKLDVY